ncbi:MAG: hypothetical protein M1470_07220 [Bacteroidetes bacterium]|nr:hypothetical protein [Bacteroidota bacterium]
MVLLDDIAISNFDENRKLIVSGDRHFLANKMTADLIQSLQTAATKEEARKIFCSKQDFTLSAEEFERVIAEKLGRFGLTGDNNVSANQRRQQYLKLKVRVLSREVAAYIARWFSFLFGYGVFWPLFAIAILISVVNFVFFTGGEIKAGGIVVSFLLFGLSTAFHEIGHVAACRHFGGKHGGMGFGFYIIWPVAYSELTGIWALRKGQRTVVNLAGIYMQLLYTAALVGGGLGTGLQELNLAATAITLSAVLQLNPFLRMDGYWVLCDLIGQPNLMSKASMAVKDLFLSIYRSAVRTAVPDQKQGKERSVLILLYGIANMSVGLILMVLIYVNYTESIVRFPEKTLTIIQSIVHSNLIFQDLTVPYLTAFTFYVLLVLQLKSALSAIIKNQPLLFSKLERKIRDK